MKCLVFAAVAGAFLCSACAKPLTALSDGKPGYKVYCDANRERCVAEMERLCGDRGYELVSERASEIRPPLGWIDAGGVLKFNSRYWMEVRCNR
jgi:hypothetical protein